MSEVIQDIVKPTAALFVDVPDLYKKVLQHKNSKVDYTHYISDVKEQFDLRFAKAYCNQNAANFRRMLQGIGFEVQCDRFAFSYHLFADVLEVAKSVDTVILGSTNAYVPMLAQKLKAMGKKVVIYACNIPNRYKTLGDCFEISEWMPIAEVQQATQGEDIPVEAPATAV